MKFSTTIPEVLAAIEGKCCEFCNKEAEIYSIDAKTGENHFWCSHACWQHSKFPLQ